MTARGPALRTLPFPVFDETEAVSEWITAEGDRRATWNLKQLLLSCTGTGCSLQGRLEFVDVKVDMNGCPVAVIVARGPGGRARGSASTLCEQEQLCTLRANYGHSRIGLRDFLEPERLTIEANPLLQARDVDADGY
jgi:hypothetical protein